MPQWPESEMSWADRQRLARRHKELRMEFYRRIAGAVDSPSRFTAKRGMGWPSIRKGVFNSVIVLPYVGNFDDPGKYSRYWTSCGTPIPRIYLNYFCDWRLSRAQASRWWGQDYGWMSRHVLELTVDVDELVDFAPWVLAWLRAAEAGDESLIPDPPHMLANDFTRTKLLATRYAWSLSALLDYHRRRFANEGCELSHRRLLQLEARRARSAV